MSGLDDVFAPREPPPAGWTRLKARIAEAERRRRVRRVQLAGLVATAAAAVAVLISPVGSRRSPLAPLLAADPALLEDAGLAPPSAAITVQHGAAELASAKGEVIFYRVSTVHSERTPR